MKQSPLWRHARSLPFVCVDIRFEPFFFLRPRHREHAIPRGEQSFPPRTGRRTIRTTCMAWSGDSQVVSHSFQVFSIQDMSTMSKHVIQVVAKLLRDFATVLFFRRLPMRYLLGPNWLSGKTLGRQRYYICLLRCLSFLNLTPRLGVETAAAYTACASARQGNSVCQYLTLRILHSLLVKYAANRMAGLFAFLHTLPEYPWPSSRAALCVNPRRGIGLGMSVAPVSSNIVWLSAKEDVSRG